MNRINFVSLITGMMATVAVGFLLGPSNVDPAHQSSWDENSGWMNWRDASGGADGVVIGADFLSGYIWNENHGWINVGDGAGPYANTNGSNFGVNILGNGDLDGFAWNENEGWINFGWAASTANADRARFDNTAGRFRGWAWAENDGWINLDDPTHFVAGSSTVTPGPLEPCPNDFELASNGAGGERLSRFGCVAAPAPPAVAGGGGSAIRVFFRTVYNTTPGDPDGASVCADRSLLTTPQPSLSQFETKTRWLGAPAEIVDDATPTPPNYIAAPLVCMAAEAAVRDWSPAGLAASFGGDADATRIYFHDPGVVPCSVYEVSQCSDPLDEATCSDPVLILTSRMADAWPPFDVLGQPNFTDINALVNKYKGIPFSPGAVPQGGPPEWHAFQAGNVFSLPGKLTSFLDISVGVDGYKGLPYREQGPCDPDTGLDNCGSFCNTAP